jgi:hypothetical protein
MSALQIPGPTPEEILAKGTNVVVKDRAGVEDTVFVRMLPMKSYPDYIRVMEDEEQAADLFTDKPGLSASLPPSSIGKIVEEGERVNADFFPWFVRRLRRMEKVDPDALRRSLTASTITSQGSASAAA